MEKLFFFDLETTGLRYWKNGIHQISGAISINGEIKEKFNFKVRPYKLAIIEDSALEVGNVTREQIADYPSMCVVYKELTAILSKYCDKYDKNDKFHLVGFNNNSFDNQFFRAFFVQNEDQYFGSWFWSDSIDCFVLASNKLRKERAKLVDFKQKTVAKYLGIEIDETKLHEAEYDVSLCIEIFKRVS
jgi:DNA polymerase-3 subunit epsilon